MKIAKNDQAFTVHTGGSEVRTGDKRMGEAVGPDEKWMYGIGGVSALVLGTAYIIIIPLFARVGAPPSGGEAWLTYLQGKTTIWWAILGLSVLTDFLYIPLALSIYMVLKQVSRSAMLVATAFVGLFIGLDLAVTWTNYASLLNLSGLYGAATGAVERATFVAAANYASAVLGSRLEVVYAIVDLSLGILIIGVVMLKAEGVFSRSTAWLAVATGISGIMCPAGIFIITLINATFATVWVLAVGYRLIRLGRK